MSMMLREKIMTDVRLLMIVVVLMVLFCEGLLMIVEVLMVLFCEELFGTPNQPGFSSFSIDAASSR